MPAFEYTALDNHGREKRGVIEGDSPRSARQQLRDKGFDPLAINQVKERQEKRSISGIFSRGISSADLALFTRQLATLVQSGIPLEEAIRTIGKHTEKPRVKRIILGVRSRVTEGYSLEKALGEFPSAFPEMYRATIAAGEKSGHLDAVLERLADYTETRQETQQSVIGALFYPIVLLIIAISVVILLVTLVVPKVVNVFTDIGQELPLPTKILIASSDFLLSYGIFILIAIIAATILFQRSMRKEAFRAKVQQFYLRLPIVGRLTRGLNTARFARTLSIMTASGVPVLDSLRIAAEVIINRPMRQAVQEAAVSVSEGANIHSSLERSGHFPPMTLHLIASGEQSGNLEDMLERAASQQERELNTIINTTLKLLEPIIIVFMGVFVLAIVMAILMPIFDLNQLVGQ
ncbi:MAG: type II secretion system inner membrane protein GspF [Gammaproteobacteria bacterium]|nr:type II secretion system inner membrane protein GspF [Gammaproteobacteria bacterium]